MIIQEEDGQLTAEDLQKKIEKVSRLIKKKGEELVFLNNSLRASDLGQDRYRYIFYFLLFALLPVLLEAALPG